MLLLAGHVDKEPPELLRDLSYMVGQDESEALEVVPVSALGGRGVLLKVTEHRA